MVPMVPIPKAAQEGVSNGGAAAANANVGTPGPWAPSRNEHHSCSTKPTGKAPRLNHCPKRLWRIVDARGVINKAERVTALPLSRWSSSSEVKEEIILPGYQWAIPSLSWCWEAQRQCPLCCAELSALQPRYSTASHPPVAARCQHRGKTNTWATDSTSLKMMEHLTSKKYLRCLFTGSKCFAKLCQRHFSFQYRDIKINNLVSKSRKRTTFTLSIP